MFLVHFDERQCEYAHYQQGVLVRNADGVSTAMEGAGNCNFFFHSAEPQSISFRRYRKQEECIERPRKCLIQRRFAEVHGIIILLLTVGSSSGKLEMILRL
jgi:hypothetical protein